MEKIGKRIKVKKFGSEFKEFVTKGNVISLATGVVIGGAFQAVVNSAVNDVFMPIIGMFTSGIDFSEAFVDLSRLKDSNLDLYETAEQAKEMGRVVVSYGTLITAIINFLVIGIVVFAIIKSITSMGDLSKKAARRKKNEPPEEAAPPPPPTTKECPYCISEISIQATRCPNCTSVLEEEAAATA